MCQYPLSKFCSKQTVFTFHYDGILWQPILLRHLRSSNWYLVQSCVPLIIPLHVTVVVSFNLIWEQFGIKSSVLSTLHTERRPSGSGSPKSVCWPQASVYQYEFKYLRGHIISLIQM